MRRPSYLGSGGSSGPGKPGPVFTRTQVPGNVDPNYGILGLENAPTSAWQPGAIAAKPYRRKSLDRRLILATGPASTTVASVADNGARSIAEPFKTREFKSRRAQSIKWLAALALSPAAPTVPASAWLVPARPTKSIRKPLKRHLLTAPAMQWQYIAPTVAAIDLDQRVFKVSYLRKIRLASPQVLFPPPTGPPAPGSAWALVKARTVSQRRRLQAQASQPSYPATSAPPSADRVIAGPFQTRISGSRKVKTPPPTPVYPAAAAGTSQADVAAYTSAKSNRRKPDGRGFIFAPIALGIPGPEVVSTPTVAAFSPKAIRRRPDTRGFIFAPMALGIPSTEVSVAPISATVQIKALRRHDKPRKVLKASLARFPATSVSTSPAVLPAFAAKRIQRRKTRQGLFLGGSAEGALSAGSTTAAVYPSFVPTGFIEREQTEFRLKTLVYPPVYPATSVVTSPDRVVAEPFRTKKSRSRKRIQTAPVIGVNPAPPPPAPPVSAINPAKVIRRHQKAGLFLGGTVSVDGFIIQQPEVSWRLVQAKRSAFTRKLRREQIQLSFPATPPVPEQSPAAYKLKTVTRSRYVRKLLPTDVQLLFPASPPPPVAVPDSSGGGWWPDYHHMRRVRDTRLQIRKEQELERRKIQDATDREIARLLAEQESRDAEAADLARIQALADRYDAKSTALPKAARVAIWNAHDARTRNALEQMLRVLDQIELEEHLALIAALLLDDDD